MVDTVQFIGPPQPAQHNGITYMAMVDGKPVKCYFTWDALCDILSYPPQAEALELFQACKRELLAIAERKIRAGEIDDGMVWVAKEDI